MKWLKNLIRKIYNLKSIKKLKNKDFSLISSNCTGAFILHDLGLKFNSPFVNLWMSPDDFIKFLKNPQYYLSCDMVFDEMDDISYPVGIIDDIQIYFQHFSTPEQAKSKWIERSKRINFDNLFIIFTDRDGCSYQNLVDFDSLPYKNKVVFTRIPYPEIKSAYYLKGFENEQSVGMCFEYKHNLSIKKYYDEFDYVSWFNNKK